MMDDRNTIRSKDLCDRCEYGGQSVHCLTMACGECPMQKPDRECKCDDVKMGTPCTYFKDKEENQ